MTILNFRAKISMNFSTEGDLFQVRAIRSDDLKTRTREVLDLAANGETFIVSRPHNRNAVILSEDEYNNIMNALSAMHYREFVNGEIDKSLTRENDPSTKWFSSQEARKRLGL